jgi:hypothetical protein
MLKVSSTMDERLQPCATNVSLLKDRCRHIVCHAAIDRVGSSIFDRLLIYDGPLDNQFFDDE